MIKMSLIVGASLLTATAAFAAPQVANHKDAAGPHATTAAIMAPQVMSDKQLDSVVAGDLGGTLTGTILLPTGTTYTDETVDVANGLVGSGTVDTTTVDPTTGTGATVTGSFTSMP